MCPNTTAARSHKKKAIENEKTHQNIKVTVGKYVIDLVKLFAEPTLARRRMVNTQSAETK